MLCLSNFPPGTIEHSVIPAAEARELIEKADAQGMLVCVSKDDLLAPYNSEALRAHRQFCKVLEEEFDIKRNIKSFCGHDGERKDTPIFTLPLQLARVNESARLLVVDCKYALDREKEPDVEERFEFEVASDSIRFHLFRYCAS